MKKRIYTRPVSVVLSEEMFDQVKGIADEADTAISDYIRAAIRELLMRDDQEANDECEK